MEQHPAHTADVAGLEVRRSLPHRALRTVGAWCFVDHFGPTAAEDDVHLRVGPHPHTGLHTVTWLLDGTEVHTDSLGSEQQIHPGEVNLMTAGHGIAHAEQTPTGPAGVTHGVQLWVAQPEGTRHGPPAFEHHADLPVVGIGPLTATVFVGALGGTDSGAGSESAPTRTDTPLVGAQLAVDGGPVEVPLDPDFEHALVVLEGSANIEGQRVGADVLCRFPVGRRSLRVETQRPTRLLLIGGTPFDEQVLMWWNFVGRTKAELASAVTEWNERSGRFGPVRSDLDRIPSPIPTWVPGAVEEMPRPPDADPSAIA